MTLPRGQSAEIAVHIRNFHSRVQQHRIELHTPAGITAVPAMLEGEVAAESTQMVTVQVHAAADLPAGVALVGLDVTRDGRRYGEWFDFMLEIR